MSHRLRLLIVEDTQVDAELLLRAVRGGGYEVGYQVVDTSAAMRAALERQDWDVITSDHAALQRSGGASASQGTTPRLAVHHCVGRN